MRLGRCWKAMFDMRTIYLLQSATQRLLGQPTGRWLAVPVKVDWPELQLTEEQMVENGVSLSTGRGRMHEDLSVFDVCLEWPDGTRIESMRY